MSDLPGGTATWLKQWALPTSANARANVSLSPHKAPLLASGRRLTNRSDCVVDAARVADGGCGSAKDGGTQGLFGESCIIRYLGSTCLTTIEACVLARPWLRHPAPCTHLQDVQMAGPINQELATLCVAVATALAELQHGLQGQQKQATHSGGSTANAGNRRAAKQQQQRPGFLG